MGNRASSGGCVYAPAPLTASSRRKRRRMGVGRRDQHVALETVWAVSVWAGSLVGQEDDESVGCSASPCADTLAAGDLKHTGRHLKCQPPHTVRVAPVLCGFMV